MYKKIECVILDNFIYKIVPFSIYQANRIIESKEEGFFLTRRGEKVDVVRTDAKGKYTRGWVDAPVEVSYDGGKSTHFISASGKVNEKSILCSNVNEHHNDVFIAVKIGKLEK